jgi:transposase-like protein
MDLPTLMDRFHSEDKCRAYLEGLRWPDGAKCPRCESDKISRIRKRHQFDCDSCRYQFSVKSGTVFHDSHLPLSKWFLAVYIMGESKKGISANQLKRMLKVSYKTAWYLCHRIRSAMFEDALDEMRGIVEMDEAYVGGKTRRADRNIDNKTMVLGAIERGGDVRFKVEGRRVRASSAILKSFIDDNIARDALIYTDAHHGYRYLDDEAIDRHEYVNHSEDEWIREDVHTQTVESVWSLLKRSIVGAYHQLSAKHLDAYMDEIAFRFNNRENRYLFRDTLLKLLEGDRLTYADLVSEDLASPERRST